MLEIFGIFFIALVILIVLSAIMINSVERPKQIKNDYLRSLKDEVTNNE